MHIVTPARMREIEGYAIGQLGIDGLILMERAALSLAQEIRAASPRAVLAICGSGNNGGSNSSNGNDDGVVDADYEVVDN